MKRGTIPWARSVYCVIADGETPIIIRAGRTRNGIRFDTLHNNDDTFRSDVASGTPVCCCLSTRRSFSRWIQTPFAQKNKALRVLPTLLDIELPFALEDCIYECTAVDRDPSGKFKGLLTGARASDITTALNSMSSLKINPTVLDHEGLALWSEALQEHPVSSPDNTAPRAIVYLGDSEIRLVTGRGAKIAGIHAIRSTDPATHITQLMRSNIAESEPVSWLFAGPGVNEPKRCNPLQTQLAETFPGSSHTASESATFLARAVARRALSHSPLPCNLLSGPFEHPLFAQRRYKKLLSAAATFLLAGLILITTAVSRNVQHANQEQKLDSILRKTASELAGYPILAKGDDAYDMTQREVKDQIQRLKPFAQYTSHNLSAVLQALLPKTTTAQLQINELRLSDDTISLSGTAPEWKAPEALLQTLRACGRQTELSRDNARDDGTIPFTIQQEGAQ
ncbi:MAG: hypothetical protein ISS35_03115 [Kiritimatiellae bacterium]|nr:hypothetical protein [Kiritimatiellia bacterium]